MPLSGGSTSMSAGRWCFQVPCMMCLRAAKWVPVLFIVTVVVWSYYAYVIQLNLFTIESVVEKCFYLIIYHVLLFMFMWAYWQTIFTDIGHVPKQFKLPPSELDRYEGAETDEIRRHTLESFTQKQNLPVFNRTMTGDIRYCDKCCTVKPDRCHHCSVCGECVLKMDHHCPWVNNCVAFTNYKYFVLFLGYALVYCLWIAATTLQYFISFWRNQLDDSSAGKFHILFVFFVSIMFAISLVSLFGYHIFLVLKNRSTLESFRAPIFRLSHTWVQDKEGFSLGAYNNFQEIFGDNRKTWFLPMSTSLGDGVAFPVKNSVGNVGNQHFTTTTATTTNTTSTTTNTTSPTTVQSYGSTNTSLGDGVTYPQRCVDEDTDGLLNQRETWCDDDEEEDHMQRFSTGFVNSNSHQTQYNLEEVVVQGNNTHAV